MNSYKILSLDIWDTVLRRKCHPDEIKLATARHLYFAYYEKLKSKYKNVQELLEARITSEKQIAEQRNMCMDDEYSIHEVFANMLAAVLTSANDRQLIVEQLYEFELEQEASVVYLDPQIVTTISQYSFDRLGYISDFYAGKDFINALLKKVQFPFPMSFQYVSCEYRLNKRSGRLFKKVLDDLQIKPQDQLHIGDNDYSDNLVPNRMGIHTLHYLPAEEHAARKKRENFYSHTSGHKLTQIINEFRLKKDTAGELAPFFCNYILWILEDCIKRKIKKIYYFTREGEFFIKLHEKFQLSNVFHQKWMPKAEILEVSRLATFAASLQEVSLEEMMRLWNQYSIQSMYAFSKSVALDDAKLIPWLEKHGIPIDDVITYPWQDGRVQNLFSDQEFITFFQTHILEQRSAFLQYANQHGLKQENPETVAIVDIGWRGSIQDNICYLFPQHHFVGYYLALEQFLNKQPLNAEKLGFLNGLPNYKMLLRIVAPIEMICNSANGSTIGYRKTKQNLWEAIRKKEEAENQIYNIYTRKLQQEILDRCDRICEVLQIHSILADRLEAVTYPRFVNILFKPQNNPDLVGAFFNLRHNEEFGVGNYIDKRTRLHLWLMFKAMWSKKARKKFNEFLNSTSWPQGYLAKYHFDILIEIYNRVLGYSKENLNGL